MAAKTNEILVIPRHKLALYKYGQGVISPDRNSDNLDHIPFVFVRELPWSQLIDCSHGPDDIAIRIIGDPILAVRLQERVNYATVHFGGPFYDPTLTEGLNPDEAIERLVKSYLAIREAIR